MRDNLPEIISIIVIIVLSVLIVFECVILMHAADDKRWNGGHCDVCGGTWQYEQAVGHRSSTSYIYVCKDCGKRIEISEVR